MLQYSRVIFSLVLAMTALRLSAHTTSVTSIESRLTTKFISLRIDLQQPDLLQIAQENDPEKRQYESTAEFQTNAAWVLNYVTNRLVVSMDETRVAGVVTNWPPKLDKLTIEIRPDQLEPVPIPFEIYWPIPKGARELKMVFNLYDTPGFSALFQILFDLGEDALPVMHVVPQGKETVIDLIAFAEDTGEPEPMPETTNAPASTNISTTNVTLTNVAATNSMSTNAAATNITSTNVASTNLASTNVLSTNSAPEPQPALPTAPNVDRSKVQVSLGEFVVVGFEHILPKGLDHILFVLGLFLLSTNWKPLLLQVTAFTIAHSLTLALAMMDIFTVSPRIVEPLIALSIAAVALENLYREDVSKARWGGVFAFGLIHGLGFAGILGEMQIPDGQFVGALVCFNIGVELGQIAVIAFAFLVVCTVHKAEWYNDRVRKPACWGLAAIGLYWCVERAFFGG